jgi:hypothetical protein
MILQCVFQIAHTRSVIAITENLQTSHTRKANILRLPKIHNMHLGEAICYGTSSVRYQARGRAGTSVRVEPRKAGWEMTSSPAELAQKIYAQLLNWKCGNCSYRVCFR